jgi:DNA-binding HxlR family transcriptional regulator
MPATVRYDAQFCPIARALDVLGDRWTLLVLRELVTGDQRFTDLRAHLPGITPALLTQRLRTLEAQGLVEAVAPEHGRRGRYRITDRGREAVPVMRALARFGMPLLGAPEPDREIRPWTAISACVTAFYDPALAGDVDERYLLRVDGTEQLLSSVPGGGEDREPDLVVDADAHVLFDLRQGRTTMRDAERDGRVRTHGPRRALRNFQRAFRLP